MSDVVKTKTYLREVLNEKDEETRTSTLQEIREWLSHNTHLNARTEDKYLLPFLRGCKYNTAKIKTKLTNFYTMKRDRPEWFENRNPHLPEIQELVKLRCFIPLKQTNDNKQVIIIRTAAHDPNKHKFNDVLKMGKMILDIMVQEFENAQIFGVTAIFDMSNTGVAHVAQLRPNVIKNAVYAWQNYHCRPKELEFIFAPFYVNFVLNVFKRFMTQKLKDRVRAHVGGLGSLHEVVDVNILPPEYGGKGESMEELANFWNEKLLQYKDWFVEDEHFKAD